MRPPLLETRQLDVTFGGLRALDGIDLAVGEGQIVGLIGPNGAGKTTFIDALTGFVPATGRITFAGHELVGTPAHRRSRLGLARTWQSLELFDDLSVADNLAVAAERQSANGFLADLVNPSRRRGREGVEFALDLLELGHLRDATPSSISQGQRKLVTVARALAARPRLICMDEPAAGLDTAESREFAGRVRRVPDAGTAVLLVDHDMSLVLDVCDHVYVIEFGRRIADGAPAEIGRDPRVVEAYLGSRHR